MTEGNGKKEEWQKTRRHRGGPVICRDPLQGKLFIAWPSLPVQFALNSPKFIIHISLFSIHLVQDQIFPLCTEPSLCLGLLEDQNLISMNLLRGSQRLSAYSEVEEK